MTRQRKPLRPSRLFAFFAALKKFQIAEDAKDPQRTQRENSLSSISVKDFDER